MDRQSLFNKMRDYIDDVEKFENAGRDAVRIVGSALKQRRLHILLPAGEALPGQALQITAAEAYAESRGVVLQIEYAH